jgi:hypothetical protein
MMASTFVRNRRLSMVSGILMLTSGAFNILWLIGVFTRILDIKELLRLTWVISPFPYIILDVGFGGNAFIASVFVILFIVGIFLSIIGGSLALSRKPRALLIGALGALICIPLLGIVSIIITEMVRRGKHQEKS